ncbi:hypothetical protein CC86DRAFT_444447 [Ophiobolus disseminans]|uniref:Uncharacterized protein n=1 Tax=Ophiobolus disseminans TaxID=1469910 RepID=A0A6A7A9D9_9PLEO|nr:hypothetical protein CC86DRAFT_444447 [Ophiobolus disseminans]
METASYCSSRLRSRLRNRLRAASVYGPQKKRTRGVTRLTSIDPKNIISPSDDDDDQPTAAGTPPTSSAPSSSYSLRNRKAKQNGLIYDLKYHPMDDSIRPTQAAKRRSAHGEEQPSSDDENGSFSVRADSDTDSDVNEEEVKKPEAVKKGKKRARHQSQSLEPTRRSSRRTADTKVLYDMSVHPQDQDLIVVSSDDDEDRSNPTTKRKRSSHSSSKSKGRTKTPHVTEISSDATDPDDEPLVSVEDSNKGPEPAPAGVPEIFIKSSSPLSFVATPPPSGIRRKEGVDVWLQAPGERYFRHDRGSWPTTPGLPFQIHVDSLEAHLEAEANAASPLSFDHDDKENEVTHPGLDETPNALDVFTVMSASQYRRTSEDSHALQERSLVNEAFFSEHHVASPYGLGGDGTQEEQNRNIVKISVSDAMSVLVSGEQLPRGPTVMDQADEIDSVLNLTSAIDADSVIGSDSTTC